MTDDEPTGPPEGQPDDPTRDTGVEEATRPADTDGEGDPARPPDTTPADDTAATGADDAAESESEPEPEPEEDTATDATGANATDGDDSEGAEAYEFAAVGDEHWPTGVEYTPEYDDRWVYTVGGRVAGSRDDVPMQGLELQVAAPREDVAAVVRACMDGLSAYEAAVGTVPRHMFVSDAAAFETVATDGAGTVAVFQPRADDGRGLVEHMTAFREGTTAPADLTPNRERARELAAHLQAALADAGLGADAVATYRETGGPPRPVADGRVYERYAALGAEGLYDPTDGPADVDSPGADGLDGLAFEPAYLDVTTPEALRDEETTADADDPGTAGRTADAVPGDQPADESAEAGADGAGDAAAATGQSADGERVDDGTTDPDDDTAEDESADTGAETAEDGDEDDTTASDDAGDEAAGLSWSDDGGT